MVRNDGISVGISCGRKLQKGAKVQLPMASTYGVYLPSQLESRWLNLGLYVLPLMERMFVL